MTTEATRIQLGPERQGLREYAVSPEDAREMLATDGWTIISDEEPSFGFDPGFRPYLVEDVYERRGCLTVDPYGIPPHDRTQARASFNFEYETARVPLLHQSDQVLLGNGKDRRVYDQFTNLASPRWQRYITSMLSIFPHLVYIDPLDDPNEVAAHNYDAVAYRESGSDSRLGNTPAWRPEGATSMPMRLDPLDSTGMRGAIVLSVFETHSNVVVGGYHQEGAHICVIDLVDANCNGGTSALRRVGEEEPFLIRRLRPGLKLIFDDRRVEHFGAHIEPGSDGSDPYRRTIIWAVELGASYMMSSYAYWQSLGEMALPGTYDMRELALR